MKDKFKLFLEFIYQKEILGQEYFNNSYSFKTKNNFKIAEIYWDSKDSPIFSKAMFLDFTKNNFL